MSSCIHCLPTETLHEILQLVPEPVKTPHWSWDNTGARIYDQPSFIQDQVSTPFILSHVCHTWRSILINSPLAWSNIAVRLRSAKSAGGSQLVKLWLQRSNSVPISVYLVNNGNASSFVNGTFANRSWQSACSTFAQLSQQMHRWRSLTLLRVPWQFLGVMMPFISTGGRCRILQSVSLQCSQENYEKEPRDIYSALEWQSPNEQQIMEAMFSSPALRYVHHNFLCCSEELRFNSLVAIPWSRLQGATINSVTASRIQILSILQFGGTLSKLQFLHLTHVYHISPENNSITFPELQYFKLDLLYTSPAKLFPFFTMPKLEHLSLVQYGPEWEPDGPATAQPILNFFERSDCKIRSFYCDDMPYGPEEMLKILSSPAMQTLTSLECIETDAYNLVVLMTNRLNKEEKEGALIPGTSSFLPSIEQIELSVYPDTVEDQADIPLMVKAFAKRPFTQLKRVFVRFKEMLGVDPVDSGAQQSMADAGVEFVENCFTKLIED
ncbi:hypothetical protein BJ165DRAFT_1450847 [Panaeolus papilionaceus]|nr:hypothetical protein BJ165DRAFT_1450847 [Panaeolus papilionaceus]